MINTNTRSSEHLVGLIVCCEGRKSYDLTPVLSLVQRSHLAFILVWSTPDAHVLSPRLLFLESDSKCGNAVLLAGWPLLYEAEGRSLGIQWPTGLLIHGPAGCGKTTLVHSVAKDFGFTVKTITPASVYGAYTGMSLKAMD